MKLFWSRWAKRSEHGRRSRRRVWHPRRVDALAPSPTRVDAPQRSGTRVGRDRLPPIAGPTAVEVAISVMRVLEYIFLAAPSLALRALLGVAAGACRRLLPPRDRPRAAAMPGAAAA